MARDGKGQELNRAYETLLVEQKGAVTLVTLNRPQALNALNNQVLSDLQARPPMQHVIVTGRGAKPEMIELADTVTEMGMVKHAFQAGIRAQKGVEL